MRFIRFAPAAALFALTLLVAPAARADGDGDGEVILGAAKEHFRAGQQAFAAGRYDEAIKELRRAYALEHRPPLLVNIARTFEKLKDARNATQFYEKYLAAAPDAADAGEIRRAIAALARAEATPVEPAAAVVPKSTTPDSSPRAAFVTDPCIAPRPLRSTGMTAVASTMEWAHEPIDSAAAGAPIDVAIQSPVSRDVKVLLNYRAAWESDFTTVEMKRHAGDKVGQIPADAVRGRSIQYYIEARNIATGAVVYAAGTQIDPNIIFLE